MITSFPHRPTFERGVIGLMVLGLAVVVIQMIPHVEVWCTGPLQEPTRESGDCVYQVIIDNIAQGVVCVDQPTSVISLLRILGEKRAGKWAIHSDPVRCNRIVRLSTGTLGVSDEKMPGSVLVRTGKKIDLNAEDAETLSAVPGLGPALARRMVRFRDSHGPFSRIDDLARVPGIGTEKIRRLEPYLKAGSSVGADAFQNVHANRRLLEPTRRVDKREMPDSSQVPHR